MDKRPSSMHPAFAGFRDVFSNTPMTIETIYVDEPPPVHPPVAVAIPRAAPQEKAIPACSILIGISVLALLLTWLWRSYALHDPLPSCRPQTTMVSTMVAKAATPEPEHAEDPFVKVDAQLQKKASDNLHNLTKCTDSKCANYRGLSKDDKSQYLKPVDDFLANHDKVMVMVYAPWCGHCKTQMPTFFEAAAESSVPFGLINAELAHPDHITGDKRVCDVKYFPTFVMIEKTPDGKKVTPLSGPPSKDNMLSMLKTDGLEGFF